MSNKILEDNIIIFNIREFVKSETTSKNKIDIPVFQRSLVWKPKQMELLWDSILRGFPIGSFTLSESDTSNNTDEGTLYLIDGQQRFNSIGIGFDDSVWNLKKEKDNLTTVLWLDIANDNQKNSSRKFWIRATTKYHPWGYEDNDECSSLSASMKREAMKSFGLDGRNIYQQPISLSNTWPYKAILPIPLYLFLKSDINSEEKFTSAVYNEIETKAPEKWKEKFSAEINKESSKSRIKELYYVFNKVENYSVSGSLISDEVIRKETKDEKDNNEAASDLEILFNRLGTGGTQITQAELIYSAITAYWGEIKDKNERLAKIYMPPANLVILAFRLISTQIKNGEPSGIPSISRIRNLKKNKTFNDNLIDLYNNKLSIILEKVDKMIAGDDINKTPAILKLDIYKNHQDLMLLLMYIADKKLNIDNSFILFIRAFVFYVIWFGLNENKIIQTVFKQINNPVLSIKDNIIKALFECVYKEFIIPIPNLNNLIENENQSDQQVKVYNLLKSNRNLLLFAQREYLNTMFPNYKPVSSFDWEEHNRPWDFDHIIPQIWINGKRGDYRDMCKEYLWTIGNFAAIPFEKNREKNANQNWEYYVEHKDELFFDFELVKDIDASITYNEKMANMFVQFCKKRINLIFKNCNEALFEHLDLEIKLTDNPNYEKLIPEIPLKRKKFFEDLIEKYKLKEFKLYYVDQDTLKEIEVDRNKVIDWSRTWISLGYVTNDFMIAITSKDGETYEIGLRKLPTDASTKETIHKSIKEKFDNFDNYTIFEKEYWWYIEKDFKENVEGEFKKFLDKCKLFD